MKHILPFLLLLLSCSPAFSQAHRAAKHRPKVALVLGGGGAKGAAEVGVLKYIEQSGVPIDMIVGTSIGSIVGGLYSVGYRSEQLDSMFRSQHWLTLMTGRNSKFSHDPIEREDSVTYLFGFPIVNNRGNKHKTHAEEGRNGMLRGDSIVAMLETMTGRPDSISFDKLPIPYRCVAVDMGPFKEVVLSHGHLAKCMRASMAIPFAFRPMKINGMTLADGGLLNNLPVDVAKAMGADIIIAVDLSVNKHDHHERLSDKISFLKELRMGKLARWIVDRPDLDKYQENVKAADIYINPQLHGYDAMDFTHHKIEKMIALGEEAGKEALPQLMELKKKLVNPQGASSQFRTSRKRGRSR